MKTWTCSKCGVEKPAESFRTMRPSGPPYRRTLQSECRPCRDASIAPAWAALQAWQWETRSRPLRMAATLEALAPQWALMSTATRPERPAEPARKRCTVCGRRKFLDDFGVIRRASSGRASRCLACERERDKKRADQRRYRARRRSGYLRRWAAANPDKVALYATRSALRNLRSKKEDLYGPDEAA